MDKNKIFGLVIILLLLPLFYVFFQVYSGEWQFKTVISGSMYPTIRAGDVVLISKTNPEKIKEQDIITFREGNTFTTHRVIKIVNNTFRTKGDANEDPDMKIIKPEQVVGKVVFTIPFLGYFGYFVRTPLGFLIFIFLPGILIIYTEIKKIRAEMKAKPKYEVARVEKNRIISKIRKERARYNTRIKILLPTYLIFVSFIAVTLFPSHTGAFFKDVELSTNNLFKISGNFSDCGEKFSVNLISPENSTITNNDGPNFKFLVLGNRENYSCELFIDNLSYGINNSVQNNTETIIKPNSSLSDGNHFWFVNCTKGSLTNQSNIWNIEIDMTPPGPINNLDEQYKGETWIYWNWTNPSDLDFNHTEIWINGSFKTNTTSNYYNVTGLNSSTWYEIQIRAVDNIGNIGNWVNDSAGTLPETYRGEGGTGGSNGGSNNNNGNSGGTTTTFSINLNFPENNTYTNKNITEFNFSVSGTKYSYTCELFLKNQTGNWTGYGINNSVQNNTPTTIILNQSFMSEGIYNWLINCTANLITNSSESRILIIDRTPPEINLLNSSFNTSEAQPEIYFNFTDNLSNQSSCILYFNNSEVGFNKSVIENKTAFLIPNFTLADGNYIVYINCTDLAGNTNKSEEISVSISTPPVTTAEAINKDGENYTFGEWINSSYVLITLNCSAVDCNTTLYCTDKNNLCKPNLTYSEPINISAEGITYLRFRSNDTGGNLEEIKNETIKIDKTNPLIQINSPNSNSGLNSTLIEINLTINETNLVYTNISIYNSTGDLVNSTTDNRTGNYTINLSVLDGIYNITAVACDFAGNCNSTEVENITVDTTPPEISNWNLTNFTIPINGTVKLNVTITDSVGVGTVKFFVEPFGNLTPENNGSEYYIICNATNPCNTTRAGVYNWTKIWANDTLGNSNFTEFSLQFNVTGI